MGTALILGGVEFRDYEIPAAINFGGRQRLVVHNLSNGTRVIDALGRDDSDISFAGIFSGSDATLRARLLDEMRASGVLFPLTWDVFLYSVVIKRFEADYRTGWWIPYRVVCSVLRDEASAIVEAAVSIAASVLADVATAGSYPANGVDLSVTQTALSQPGAMLPGTTSYTSAMASLGQSSSGIDTGIATTEANLNGLVTSQLSTPSTAIAALPAMVGAAGQLGGLTAARGYLGRAATNMTNVST